MLVAPKKLDIFLGILLDKSVLLVNGETGFP